MDVSLETKMVTVVPFWGVGGYDLWRPCKQLVSHPSWLNG